jgi:hypothetical protein
VPGGVADYGAVTGSTSAFRLSEFELDAQTGILHPRGVAVPAGYLDGAEQELLERLPLIGDLSTGSDELRRLMRNWPTSYHLTPYRATLFDALGFSRAARARVLELGAGCGAITRWLGENFAEVHAIEGDSSRARVARARCADLESVQIYCANYSQLEEREAFDVVTLIGVLEYGHLYHPEHQGNPEAAALANLVVAREALAQDGVLVLAIENRLGVKYLNGAREDHSGRLFEGIQGYVSQKSPVTFSARALERMLGQAGFGDVDFLLPFPDYKLAKTIINPSRCDDEHRIHQWIDGAAPDRGTERGPLLYNESLALRELSNAGLLRDLANSFLVVAYRDGREGAVEALGLDLEWSARHYSLDRRIGLRKRATLRADMVEHEHAPFGDAKAHGARQSMELFGMAHDPRPEPFRKGDSLLMLIMEAIAAEGLGKRVSVSLQAWYRWLVETFGTDDGSAVHRFVGGDAFDASWWNIIVEPATGEWQLIDSEWRLAQSVPVDFVVWRTITHFLLRHRAQLPEALRSHSLHDLRTAMLGMTGIVVTDHEQEAFEGLDTELAMTIGPGAMPAGPSAQLERVRALALPPVRSFAVLALADELAADPGLLAAYAQRFAAHDSATLVIYAPDAEPEATGEAIIRALEVADLTGPTPDLMLLAVPSGEDAEAAIMQQALALLSDRPAPAAFAELPRFAAAEADGLRRLAETTWS